jgi:mannose-6-phosphate isomerase-like protein (cupin superfamily)
MSTTTASPRPQSATAAGEPRWFFGSLARVLAGSADTAGSYTMLELEMPPNLEAPLHVHRWEDEGFYVLEGSATIYVGDDSVELGPGEHAFGPRNIPHRFTIGPDGARMIWVLTPGGFEDFVHEASVRAETLTVAPPDIGPPPDIAEIALRYGNEILGSD